MAPVAVTVIVALKEPATSAAVFTDRVTGFVPVVVVPDAGVSVSQLALSAADQVRVPLPEFVMFSDCEGGFAAPCVAANEKLVGLAPMAGGTGAAATVNDTGTVTGVAPGALRVTVPL